MTFVAGWRPRPYSVVKEHVLHEREIFAGGEALPFAFCEADKLGAVPVVSELEGGEPGGGAGGVVDHGRAAAGGGGVAGEPGVGDGVAVAREEVSQVGLACALGVQ